MTTPVLSSRLCKLLYWVKALPSSNSVTVLYDLLEAMELANANQKDTIEAFTMGYYEMTRIPLFKVSRDTSHEIGTLIEEYLYDEGDNNGSYMRLLFAIKDAVNKADLSWCTSQLAISMFTSSVKRKGEVFLISPLLSTFFLWVKYNTANATVKDLKRYLVERLPYLQQKLEVSGGLSAVLYQLWHEIKSQPRFGIEPMLLENVDKLLEHCCSHVRSVDAEEVLITALSKIVKDYRLIYPVNNISIDIYPLPPVPDPIISDRLLALLRWAKAPGCNHSPEKAKEALADLYVTDMEDDVLLYHLAQAYSEFLEEKRFCHGQSAATILSLLVLAPISQENMFQLDPLPSSNAEFTKMYIKKVTKHIAVRLQNSNMLWCNWLIFPDKFTPPARPVYVPKHKR